MNWAEIKTNDIANGEGVRTSLFVSGCRHHCKNCFNEVTWDFGYGNLFTEETMEQIFESVDHEWINGISLLGGEPFEPENQPQVLELLKKVRQMYPNKTIWCFTGDTLETDLLAEGGCGRCAVTDELLSRIDVLVDGPFIAEQRNLMLRFRGCENQRLIDLKSTLKTGSVVLWEDEAE